VNPTDKRFLVSISGLNFSENSDTLLSEFYFVPVSLFVVRIWMTGTVIASCREGELHADLCALLWMADFI